MLVEPPLRRFPRTWPLRLGVRVVAWFAGWRARAMAVSQGGPEHPPRAADPVPRPPGAGAQRRNDVQHISAAVARLQAPLKFRQDAERDLEPDEERDSLTGLHNRAFLATLSQRLEQEPPSAAMEFCVLRLDLEDLDPIRDRHGPGAGDQALVQVATRLRHCVRPQDFLFRLEGDGFMLLLPCPVGEGFSLARRIGTRVVKDLQRPVSYLTLSNLRVGCSVGAALWVQDSATLTDAIRNADDALGAAKRAGRGQIRHYAAVTHAAAAAAAAALR